MNEPRVEVPLKPNDDLVAALLHVHRSKVTDIHRQKAQFLWTNYIRIANPPKRTMTCAFCENEIPVSEVLVHRCEQMRGTDAA